MQDETQFDRVLTDLGGSDAISVPDDFMDAVWMRAGRMEEASMRRTRSAMLGAMMVVGLAAGFSAAQAPARAEVPTSQLVDGTDLSPAALLHVQP